MKKRNIDKTELDLIGRKLIERGSLPTADIDKIVSNPDLFSLINSRIVAEGNAYKTNATAGWALFSFIRRNAAAFAGVAVMLPYLLSIAALAVAVNRARPPAALSKPFERGEA